MCSDAPDEPELSVSPVIAELELSFKHEPTNETDRHARFIL